MATTHTTANKPAKSTRSKKAAPDVAQDAADQSLLQVLIATPVQLLAYSQLSGSDLNVRLIPHSEKEVEELADSIAAVGILQNLIGVELPDGTIGVVGGEGRRKATGVLVQRGVVMADAAFVPVKVIPLELAVVASMTENGQRKNMHPAEQIVGFRTLEREGKTASQIAALLGYAPRHVQRCLKLANLAPSLLDALARDEIALEQCEALTLSDTHARQEQIWEEATATWHSPSVNTLRRMATDDKLAVSHPMFVFVGEDAYSAAGGELARDLFSDADSTFADAALVKTLLADKLTTLAQQLKQEQGWSWAEYRMTALNERGEDSAQYRFAMPAPVLSTEEQQRVCELEEKIENSDNYDDDYVTQQEIDDIYVAATYREATPEFRAAHGIWVSWDDGDFKVQPGIRKLTDEERAQEEETRQARVDNVIRHQTPDAPADCCPATLVKAMSAERTLAVQAELARRPDVAVALLTWTLCLKVFDHGYGYTPNPLIASVTNNQHLLSALAPSGNEGKALLALTAQREALQATLPEGWETGFTWLLSWPVEQVNALLGFCAAHGIDGLQERLYKRTQASSLDGLEAALDFDLRKWWQPDAESYFGKLKIAQIGEAYEEAGLSGRARDIVKLKRRDAAVAAAEDLNACGWLPEWMVRAEPAAADDNATDTDLTDHAA